MHAQRVDASLLHARKPSAVVLRLALALDRQVDGGLHRRGALSEDGRAPVVARRRSRGHHHMLDVIELDRGLRHLGKLRRRLALDGAAGGERLADGAKLAGLGAARVADTALQYRGRENVAAMKGGDMRIGNALRGGALIETR